jgi:hypothetical protein
MLSLAVAHKVADKAGMNWPSTVEGQIKLCREIVMDDLISMAAPLVMEHGPKLFKWIAEKIFGSKADQ